MRFVLFSGALLAAGVASAAMPVNGWYSSLFGGYTNLPSNVSTTVLGVFFSEPSYKNGYNAGLRLGYQSFPIRYELEYTYIHGDTDDFKVFGISQTGVSGNLTANLGMANLYFDFRDVILPTIYPFIGGGIGYAWLKSSLESTGPLGPTLFEASKGSYAYQGTAGLTYNFAENFALNVAYRYAASTSSDSFGQAFKAHMSNAAIIYRFDQCNYK